MKDIKEFLNESMMNESVHPEDRKTIKTALASGHIEIEGKDYAVTLENVITSVFDPKLTGVDEKELAKIVAELKKEGSEIKYNTNKEAEADAKKNKWEIA